MDSNLKLSVKNGYQRNSYMCERKLPTSVPYCPYFCDYCETDNNLQFKCICPQGKFGRRCLYRNIFISLSIEIIIT